VEKLTAYRWPGNIRELQHAVERAVIMSEGKVLSPGDFLLESKDRSIEVNLGSGKMEDIEKVAITQALKKGRRNMDQVAKEVGLSRSTLYRKMKKYGL